MRRIAGTIALAGLLALACGAAQAVPVTYVAHLSGANEAVPNASPGTGIGFVTIDTDANLLSVNITFSGLIAGPGTTAAHIHCCTATPGVIPPTVSPATQTPTFVGFPLGVTAGAYSMTFDTDLASTWNGSFVTANGGTAAGAEAAFAQGLEQGRAYLNIHSTDFPGGEILGFLTPVPEPSSLALLALGAVAVLARRRRASVA